MSSTTNILPAQSAPIDRTPAGAMAFAASSGVQASRVLGRPRRCGQSRRPCCAARAGRPDLKPSRVHRRDLAGAPSVDHDTRIAARQLRDANMQAAAFRAPSDQTIRGAGLSDS